MGRLEFTPAKEVTFKCDDLTVEEEVNVTIKNTSKTLPVAFKAKITDGAFKVKPMKGEIGPMETITLTVTRTVLSLDRAQRRISGEQILVMYVPIKAVRESLDSGNSTNSSASTTSSLTRGTVARAWAHAREIKHRINIKLGVPEPSTKAKATAKQGTGDKSATAALPEGKDVGAKKGEEKTAETAAESPALVL